jgi:hypothetical protein
MTKRWTDEDVERLVEAAGVALKKLDPSYDITGPALAKALAPFQPDSDEELNQQITDLRGQSDYRDNAAIIAAVRAHDAQLEATR